MTGKRTFLIIKRDEQNKDYIAEVKHSDYYPSPDRYDHSYQKIVEIPNEGSCHIILGKHEEL